MATSPDDKSNSDSPCKPNVAFHLAIDQKDRIRITSASWSRRHALPGK
jgi:hypothetical protein